MVRFWPTFGRSFSTSLFGCSQKITTNCARKGALYISAERELLQTFSPHPSFISFYFSSFCFLGFLAFSSSFFSAFSCSCSQLYISTGLAFRLYFTSTIFKNESGFRMCHTCQKKRKKKKKRKHLPCINSESANLNQNTPTTHAKFPHPFFSNCSCNDL